MFNSFAERLDWLLKQGTQRELEYYLDDFIFVIPAKENALKATREVWDVLTTSLGVLHKKKKVDKGASLLESLVL